ncbi:MAG: PorV/PorQ family protein [Bacteroidetes bacterium]|nr:PorV/PorQ family protein [Bacteroidota bacterium]
MKKSNRLNKNSIIVAALALTFGVNAGNEDRVGSASGTHLLVNPWARSSALGDAGVASTRGLEATFTNIAGLAFAEKTQLKFNSTNWLGSAGVQFYSAGLAQRISEESVIAVSVQSMNFGDILITQVELPEGGIGTFSPRLNVVNLGYAKSFSSSIYAGINLKVISESIANMKGNGIALDAGIRYVTGEQDQMKFGITLKNVGPTMRYKGDGLIQQTTVNSTGQIVSTDVRTSANELPSCLSIGGSYDFNLDEKNKIVANAAFTANSFFYDQFRVGVDYGMTTDKLAFNVRAGYVYEQNIQSAENRSNALIGPSLGFSVDGLAGKNKNALGAEYAARFAGIFGIIHTFGISINLK